MLGVISFCNSCQKSVNKNVLSGVYQIKLFVFLQTFVKLAVFTDNFEIIFPAPEQ